MTKAGLPTFSIPSDPHSSLLACEPSPYLSYPLLSSDVLFWRLYLSVTISRDCSTSSLKRVWKIMSVFYLHNGIPDWATPSVSKPLISRHFIITHPIAIIAIASVMSDSRVIARQTAFSQLSRASRATFLVSRTASPVAVASTCCIRGAWAKR